MFTLKTLCDVMMKERRYQPTCPASFHRQCPVRPQSAPPSAAGCQYWWPQNSPSCQCQHCNTIHQHFTRCWCSVNSPFCQCQHDNTVTSHDVYAHKIACTANTSTTMQLLQMMFMLTKQPILPMQALQCNYFSWHLCYLKKQPVLPMPALQFNYFTWCLYFKNSLFWQCQQCKHYNGITSHDIYAILKKQPILPMPALQSTWCLYF